MPSTIEMGGQDQQEAEKREFQLNEAKRLAQNGNFSKSRIREIR